MPIETDAVIIGAGPIGLFQAFQLGLQGIKAHIVDALPHAGGQCIELYADKPIYDIPAVKVCTGRELIAQLLQQLQPFAPVFHFESLVSAVAPQPDGRFLLQTSACADTDNSIGTEFLTKTVFIAAGVGAFQPRTIALADTLGSAKRHIQHRLVAGSTPRGRHLVINGDGDQALEAALDLVARNAQLPTADKRHITLLHRRDAFSANAATVATFKEHLAQGSLQFVVGQISNLHAPADTMQSIDVVQSDGALRTLPCDQLWVLQGLSPKLGPIANWGLPMQRRQLQVNTENFATNVAGIFAVGDINTYPGKKKLILCGFHECVLAAFGAMEHIHPGAKAPLLYTTTSTRLHDLLGVSPVVSN